MSTQAEPRLPATVNRGLGVAENIVYAGVGVVLIGGAVVLLCAAVFRIVHDLEQGVDKAIQEGLDALLLVFVLVELLAAVRATLSQRRLVAEPFVVVGMIATIKEIIVASIRAKDALEHNHEEFRLAMLEIGVLGGLLLALAIALYLVRRKEREPEE
jgi:uncharacterized membrane protein (DUF373 family)